MVRAAPITLEIQDRLEAIQFITDQSPRSRQRAAILLLSSYGFTPRVMVEELGCDRGTTKRITDLFRETGNVPYVVGSSTGGRPRKTTKPAIRSATWSVLAEEQRKRPRLRAAHKLEVHESTISRELRRRREPNKPSRRPKHLGWDRSNRSIFIGDSRRNWITAPFINYPSSEALDEATRQIIDTKLWGQEKKWTVWENVRDRTSGGGIDQNIKLKWCEPALWQDIAIILAESWLVPKHPAHQLWRELPTGELATSYALLEAGRLSAEEGRWQAIKGHIEDEPQQIASSLKIDPAVFVGTAIIQWEKTYTRCFTNIATWLRDIGIAKSIEEMPKNTRKVAVKQEEAGGEKDKPPKDITSQWWWDPITKGDRRLMQQGKIKPPDPPPRPWCWDPFDMQHSPLAPPRIFREFMARYGHLTKT